MVMNARRDSSDTGRGSARCCAFRECRPPHGRTATRAGAAGLPVRPFVTNSGTPCLAYPSCDAGILGNEVSATEMMSACRPWEALTRVSVRNQVCAAGRATVPLISMPFSVVRLRVFVAVRIGRTETSHSLASVIAAFSRLHVVA